MSTMKLLEEMEIPNNYRRMHGEKPKRWKHIWNARNKRIRKARSKVDISLAFANFGISLKKASESFNKMAQTIKEYEGDVFKK